MSDAWSASLAQLKRLRWRLGVRQLLRRCLLLASLLFGATSLLLIGGHLWPALTIPFAAATAIGVIGAILLLAIRQREVPLSEAAWLVDRQLKLDEQTVSALEAPDEPFGTLLREKTAPLLAAATNRELAPFRFGARTGTAITAAGCLAVLLLLLGLPDSNPQAAAEQRSLHKAADGLLRTARHLEVLGAPRASQEFKQLAGKMQRSVNREQGRMLGAQALSEFEAQQRKAVGADAALRNLSRQPELSAAVQAARKGQAAQLTHRLDQLAHQASGGAGLARAARSLERAARLLRDPQLARRLTQVARLTGQGKLPTNALRTLLTDLASHARRNVPLALAVTRLGGTVQQLGGGLNRKDLGRTIEKTGDGGARGALAAKPERIVTVRSDPLSAQVVKQPPDLEQMLRHPRWPPEEDRLIRTYFEKLHER